MSWSCPFEGCMIPKDRGHALLLLTIKEGIKHWVSYANTPVLAEWTSLSVKEWEGRFIHILCKKFSKCIFFYVLLYLLYHNTTFIFFPQLRTRTISFTIFTTSVTPQCQKYHGCSNNAYYFNLSTCGYYLSASKWPSSHKNWKEKV